MAVAELYAEQYAEKPDCRNRTAGPEIESQQNSDDPAGQDPAPDRKESIIGTKITFEMTSIMKNVIRRSVNVSRLSPRSGRTSAPTIPNKATEAS